MSGISALRGRSTIRARLTLLYACAFFLAGAALVGMMYLQLNQVIGQQMTFRSVVIGGPGGANAPALGLSAITDAQAQVRKAREEVLRRVLVVSAISLVAVGFAAALLGWLLAGQALQPLRQITLTLRGIADRNLHQRIAMKGAQDEIKDLADTLDGMLERLDRAFDSQSRFIANASHELRTPLAINRTLIEVAMLKEPDPYASIIKVGSVLLAVNERHERLIDGLLMLASSEQELSDPKRVEIADIAKHVLEESAQMADTAGVEVRSYIAPAMCWGDSILLERLVQNLVDNAIRYNLPEDGWVRVMTSTNSQGQATLVVENTGPNIPSYEVPRLFEPFRRLASTERLADASSKMRRRGAGLGLSIVRAVLTSHGGEIEALPREEGGLFITVVLPGHKR